MALQPRRGRGAVAELNVAAGDVVLFKYATGRPFAGL